MDITSMLSPGPVLARPRTPEQIAKGEKDKKISEALAKDFPKAKVEEAITKGDVKTILALKHKYLEAGGDAKDFSKFLHDNYSPNVQKGVDYILHHQHSVAKLANSSFGFDSSIIYNQSSKL